MKTPEFRRDLNHNYLVLTCEEPFDREAYPVRMLTAARIPAMLSCHLQGVDGETLLYYDITSRQSLQMIFEETAQKMGAADLRMIFDSLVEILESMNEYLMNPSHLLLSPEYLFVSLAKRRVSFCYAPDFSGDVQKEMMEICEYVLPRIDHDDSMAVRIGYGLYRHLTSGELRLEALKQELYLQERETPSEEQKESLPGGGPWEGTPEPEEERKEEPGFPPWREEFQEPEKKKESGLFGRAGRKLFLAAAAALVLAGLLALKHFGYLPMISRRTLYLFAAAAFGLVLLFLGISAFLEEHSKKKKESAPAVSPWVQESREDVYTELSSFTGYEETSSRDMETEFLYVTPRELPARLLPGPDNPGGELVLRGDVLMVGKLLSRADLLVEDPTVSRVHARLRKADGKWYLRDLSSRNGTCVNGRLLEEKEEVPLKEGDEVGFARMLYRYTEETSGKQ